RTQKLVAESDIDRLCVRASGSNEKACYRKSPPNQATPSVHVGYARQALRRVKRSRGCSAVASICGHRHVHGDRMVLQQKLYCVASRSCNQLHTCGRWPFYTANPVSIDIDSSQKTETRSRKPQ